MAEPHPATVVAEVLRRAESIVARAGWLALGHDDAPDWAVYVYADDDESIAVSVIPRRELADGLERANPGHQSVRLAAAMLRLEPDADRVRACVVTPYGVSSFQWHAEWTAPPRGPAADLVVEGGAVVVREIPEPAYCAHGRPGGYLCPHCLGLNGARR